MPLITILIPCYNEEQSLPALYEALCTICNPLQEVSSSNICEGITPPIKIPIRLNFCSLTMVQ